MEYLSGQELNFAKDIMDEGLKKAAESLSFFMKENISLREIDFNITNKQEALSFKNTSEEELYILTTEVKGEIKGVCYLVLNNVEKNELCRAALPADMFDDPNKLKNMQEPLLLEVDNIISASVITKIANALKKKMYGDVPGLSIMSSSEFKNVLKDKMKPDMLMIGLQTEFMSDKTHFHPEYLWILDAEFLNSVKTSLPLYA